MERTIDYEARYDDPAQLLADPSLAHEDKLELLKAWRLDAERRSESTSEGMDGGPSPQLAAVDRALTQLQEQHN